MENTNNYMRYEVKKCERRIMKIIGSSGTFLINRLVISDG